MCTLCVNERPLSRSYCLFLLEVDYVYEFKSSSYNYKNACVKQICYFVNFTSINYEQYCIHTVILTISMNNEINFS